MKSHMTEAWEALTESTRDALVQLDRYTHPSRPKARVGIDGRSAEVLVRRGLAAGGKGERWRITHRGQAVAAERNNTHPVPGGAAIKYESKGMVKCGAVLPPKAVRAMNRDYQKACELRDRVWEKLEDVQQAMGEAGMISIIWTRDVGPVDTILSDALGDALSVFTEGSGLEVLVTERRKGEGTRSCLLEALQLFFPDLEIKRKG